MKQDEEMKEKLAQTTTTFTIAGVPIETYERFIAYCEKNSTVTKVYYKDNKQEIKKEQWYAGALKMLLDAVEADAKNKMLFDRIVAIEKKLNGDKK